LIIILNFKDYRLIRGNNASNIIHKTSNINFDPCSCNRYGGYSFNQSIGGTMNKYFLKAISGDCSAGGLSDKGDIIPIKDKHLNIVREYLTASNTFYYTENHKNLLEMNDLGNQLIDLGIFEHKWHKRTEWILINQ